MKPRQILQNDGEKRAALSFIVLLGVVSLFGDITYESARSVTGPFLLTLGANAVIVGLVAGLGEFIGYALRLLSGFLADRTKSYWFFVTVGYGLILCIPLLALTDIWQIAAIFIILERLGKAIRTPARDTILSHATKKVGRGWGFGIHEALDQVGALAGPLILSFVFFLGAGYKEGFGILLVPAILTLVVLSLAKKKVPLPEKLEISTDKQTGTGQGGEENKKLPTAFWFYSLFIFLTTVGFANFPLISYHFKVLSVVPDVQIPLLYALAMGVDALMALAIGKIYDKSGFSSLFAVPLLSACIVPLAFSRGFIPVLIAIFLWGMTMGMHETIMRAAIADLAPLERRGVAYGIFNTLYGVSLLLGGVIMGFLYSFSLCWLILFALVMQVFSLPILFSLIKKTSF